MHKIGEVWYSRFWVFMSADRHTQTHHRQTHTSQ